MTYIHTYVFLRDTNIDVQFARMVANDSFAFRKFQFIAAISKTHASASVVRALRVQGRANVETNKQPYFFLRYHPSRHAASAGINMNTILTKDVIYYKYV